MSTRKEEERNEKIIRGLMKLPPNRRCINCNSLGPQFVCTNFWTFVCMTCSGIHREFTHRVKSVSMSKFTSQEVEALQEGGNQRARETFLKDWDPREQRLPDNSNVDKVRDFIKNVYVDKKFFASKASGKPPTFQNLRNNEDETRRASSYHSYSQSPPYDYQYEERRYGKQAPALTKKPGSDRGMFRFLSTSRLSDHVQEDSFANEMPIARASDYSVSSGVDPFRSDTNQRELGFSSPSSETSRDNLSEDKGDSDQVTNAQKPASSGNIAQVNSVGKNFIAPTSEQSGKFDGLDLFSAPFAPVTSEPSTESKKFDGLDLFNPPQSTTSSSPSSVIDLFDLSATSSTLPINTSQPVNQQFQAFDPSSLDLFADKPLKDKSPDTITQKNEGWATFDMPWHAEPKTSTSHESVGKFDQTPSMPFHQEFSALVHNPWHEGVHNIGDPPSVQNNQSWSSFEESNTPFNSIYTKSSEQDPYLAWGTSHQDGPQSHALDTKSRNPFDFPSETDLETSNMFLDMGSLQSSLPNVNMSTSWFPETPDALMFNGGLPPTMQIPNIQGQEPVASIGGNPFG